MSRARFNFLTFISVIILSGAVFSWAQEEKPPTTAEEIITLLESKRIMLPEEREELGSLLEKFIGEEQELEDLQDIVFKMILKIENEKENLIRLSRDLNKLNYTDYSRKIAHIRNDRLRYFEKQTKELESKVRSTLPKYCAVTKIATQEGYHKEILRISQLLLETKGTMSIPTVYFYIENQAKDAYAKWNEHRRELNNRVAAKEKDFARDKTILGYEEFNFIELFEKVQYQFRKFSESQSADF